MNSVLQESLIDWSRAQFALTAAYHWLFVPLTLGLGLVIALMETRYYRTGELFWKQATQFWMKLFGINFAIGVATGLILEFQFGTNWSNYSWLVGDIFGAPLAIEGIIAFFMEATFISIMFFGWEKVSKRAHLLSTWLTWLGASISAWWILVANAWMQYPVGMTFNPDTMRHEMVDFRAVAFSPVAVNKYWHTVASSWLLSVLFVLGVCAWYLLRKRHLRFSLESAKTALPIGVLALLVTAMTGDRSGVLVAKVQPMKLAAMEAHYSAKEGGDLVVCGVLDPRKSRYDDGIDPFLWKWTIPDALSLLSRHERGATVPGMTDLAEAAQHRIDSGRIAIHALKGYRLALKSDDSALADEARAMFERHYPHLGYGYITDPEQLIPPVAITFYAFRVMVGLCLFFVVLMLGYGWHLYRGNLPERRGWLWGAVAAVPLAYMASQAGWIVTEVGRQPWVIQDLLPTWAAVSRLETTAVQTTFCLFAILFTVLLVAELRIMGKAIVAGPKTTE